MSESSERFNRSSSSKAVLVEKPCLQSRPHSRLPINLKHFFFSSSSRHLVDLQSTHQMQFSSFIQSSTVPIGLSRVQVVPAQSSPAFQKKLINDATITTSTSNKNNNNKTVTAITTTTTSTAGGHLVKGKQRKFNILWEHNYA